MRLELEVACKICSINTTLKVADSIYARKLGPKWVHGAPKRPVTDPQTAWLTSPWAQLADTDPLAGWGDKKFSAGNS